QTSQRRAIVRDLLTKSVPILAHARKTAKGHRPQESTVRRESSSVSPRGRASIAMSQEIDTPEGKIVFASEVIATIAGLAAMECYGVVGMAARSLQDGLAGILGRENLTRGVQVASQGGELVITLGIIVG